MVNLIEFLQDSEKFLRKNKIEQPRCDAEWVFSFVLKCSRTELYLNRNKKISEEQKFELQKLLNRRSLREPLQYILGDVKFFDITLEVNENVLIPRPETETLVDWLCRQNFYKNEQELNIIDLGTGSGAIAISLAKYYKNSSVLAVDKSKNALDVATKNAKINAAENIKFLESDWFAGVSNDEKFDIIVSNPPYLTQQEFDIAQDEVKKYEPKIALVSDNHGMKDLEEILENAEFYAKNNAIIALETGLGHAKILQEKYKNKFHKTIILKDLFEIDRFFIAYINKKNK